MRLVHKESQKEVQVGDEVFDFRGERAVVVNFSPPRSPASSGKVTVKNPDDDRDQREYYVGVFNMEWIEREDRESPKAVIDDIEALALACNCSSCRGES